MDENKVETKTVAKGKLLTFIKGLSKKAKLIIVLTMVVIVGIDAFV